MGTGNLETPLATPGGGGAISVIDSRWAGYYLSHDLSYFLH